MTGLAEDLEVGVRGSQLHAQRWGSRAAPLVIGFPGLSGTAERCSLLGERIGGDELQLVALDPRGRGKSDTTAPGSYGWENHARDALAVADALGFERFSMIGMSMGGSVAMKTAELDATRLDRVVLIDIAGRVDRGVGAVIAGEIDNLGLYHDPADPAAVEEDRAYTFSQDPYDRWRFLTMPTLLVRATREMRPGCGFVVPVADRDRFVREVPKAILVEVDADHRTIADHPDTAHAIRSFLVPS
ncbi:MAG TPA: alpha/beta hydrolase [Acidimicrobiia bacterium]|jgi:pimeloyl-ACP methyl ester carboxylesterase